MMPLPPIRSCLTKGVPADPPVDEWGLPTPSPRCSNPLTPRSVGDTQPRCRRHVRLPVAASTGARFGCSRHCCMDSPGRTDASSGSGVPSRRVLLGVDHATTQPRLVRIRVELRATDRLRSQPSSTSVRRWNLLQMPSSPRRVLRGLHRLFDPLTLTPATGRECGERAVDGEEPEPATFGLGCF